MGDEAELADQVGDGHPVEPLGVAADLEHLRVVAKHHGDLAQERLGVRLDLVRGEYRPGPAASGRVADPGGGVADQKHDDVPEVLQVAHHTEVDRVAQMQVRRRAVDAELDPHRPPRCESVDQVGAAEDLVGRPSQVGEHGLAVVHLGPPRWCARARTDAATRSETTKGEDHVVLTSDSGVAAGYVRGARANGSHQSRSDTRDASARSAAYPITGVETETVGEAPLPDRALPCADVTSAVGARLPAHLTSHGAGCR